MTLWLTLLLAWTVGIPAAFFLTGFVALRLNQRRAQRLPVTIGGSLRVASVAGCGRRVHPYRALPRHAEAVRPRAGFRRRT